jgi:hypothetical protein
VGIPWLALEDHWSIKEGITPEHSSLIGAHSDLIQVSTLQSTLADLEFSEALIRTDLAFAVPGLSANSQQLVVSLRLVDLIKSHISLGFQV